RHRQLRPGRSADRPPHHAAAQRRRAIPHPHARAVSPREVVSPMVPMAHDVLVAEVESLRRSEPASALARLEAGFVSALRQADAAGRGALGRLRAHVLRSLRRAREASLAYRRAAAWYAKARDVREQGRCAIGLVDALMYLGRYADARRAAAVGRRLLQK